MKKLMAFVLLVCLIVSALPVSAAQNIPELQVVLGHFAWQPVYAAQDDGGIACAFVYGAYYGDEWIAPEELRVEARTDKEGVSFACGTDADGQCVYVYGTEAADEFFYTVDVYYDVRNAHWESEPLDCLILPEEVEPIFESAPADDIGTGEGLEAPALHNVLNTQWRTSPFEPFTLDLPFLYTGDENWRAVYSVSSDTVEFEVSDPYCTENGLYALDFSGFSGEGTIEVAYFLQYMQDGEIVFSRKAGASVLDVAYWPLEIIWNSRNYEATIGHEPIIVGEIGAICSYGIALEPDDYTLMLSSFDEKAEVTTVPGEDGSFTVILSGVEETGWITVEVAVEEKDTGILRAQYYDIYCSDGRFIDYGVFSSFNTYDPTVAQFRAICQDGIELPLSDFDVEFTSSVPGVTFEWKDDGWVWTEGAAFTQDSGIDLRICVTHKETGEIWMDEEFLIDYRQIDVPEVSGVTPPDPQGYFVAAGQVITIPVPTELDPQAAQEGWYIDVRWSEDLLVGTVEDGLAHFSGIHPGYGFVEVFLNNDRYSTSVSLAVYSICIEFVQPTLIELIEPWPAETAVSICKGETYAFKKPLIGTDGAPEDGWYLKMECFEPQFFEVTEDEEYFYIKALTGKGDYTYVYLSLLHDEWHRIENIENYAFQTVSAELDFSLRVPETISATTGENDAKWFGNVIDICLNGQPLSPDEFEIYAYSDSENVDIFVHRNDGSDLNRVMLYYGEALQGEKVTVQVNCFTKDREHFLYKTFILEVR